MSRSIMSGVIGAAVLLASCYVGQTSFGQDRWDHGFGSRNYGDSGRSQTYNNHSNHNQSSHYGHSDWHNGHQHRHSVGYPRYYSSGRPALGGYSTGAYGYSSAPMYYGYRPAIGGSYGYSGIGLNIGIGAVPPTSPYYEPLGVHRHGNTLYAPIPRQRSAW
jgi:hypothetical protein